METENSFIIIKSATLFEVYVEFFLDSEHLYFDGHTESNILRLMTDLEKQILLNKLHEAGKDWDAEKCEIVAIKYIPEIGDCVKVQLWDGEFCVFECTEKDQESVNSRTYIYQPKQKVFIDDDSEFGWGLNRDGNVFTKITPEDLQSEFNRLGYMYDFAAHTAKLIEWKPKAGDSIWSINAKGLINEWTFSGRGSFVPDSMDFRAPELAESALELLKSAKHY